MCIRDRIYVFTDSAVEIPQDAHLRAVGEGASNVSLMDMSLQPEENTAFVRLVSWGGDAQVEVCLLYTSRCV